MPNQGLARRLYEAGLDRFGSVVRAQHTTASLKEDAFGFLKLLIQQRPLGIERLHFPLGDLFRDLLRLAGGLGGLDGDFLLLGHQ